MKILRAAIAYDLMMISERYTLISKKIEDCLDEVKDWDRQRRSDFEEGYKKLTQMTNELKDVVAMTHASLNPLTKPTLAEVKEKPSYYPSIQEKNVIPDTPKSRTSRKRAQ